MSAEEPHLEAYRQAFSQLTAAIEQAPTEQLALLAAVDELYAVINDGADVLDDAAMLDAQIMLRHAESVLTRYFGM